MAPRGLEMTAGNRAEPAGNQTKPLLIPLIASLLLIGALFSVDFFLATMEHTELTGEARDHYRDGLALLQQKRAPEAVEQLRRAWSLDRANREYQLQYAAALLAAKKLDEAGKQLDDLLQADPNDGPANLLAARLRVRQGNVEDAESHYHRAIFGSWKDKPAAHRLDVRLELANLLASRGDQGDLLAELLPLESEAPDEPALRARLGRLFLQAGSPSRAADVFRELVRSSTDAASDADAYLGLGQAELDLGNYRDAFTAFVSALRCDPNARGAKEKMMLSSTMTALDPTLRRLSPEEKYARSARILEMARDSLQQCLSGGMVTEPSKLQALLANANATLSAGASPHVTNEVAEERLALAEQLWQAGAKACPPGSSDREEPLRLIMEKLARTAGR
jgi:tetratricopeptide (TPR) repeat protein